jgi:hypothetical protein
VPRKNSKLAWTLLILIFALIIFVLYFFFIRQRADVNPFNAKTLEAVDFPLYYPTYLPPRYRIDSKSVNMPQSGVVVFTLDGPDHQHLYMSEESRPDTFNFGGYYKEFSDLKETVVASGTIAVGRINNGQTEIGSLATEKTWILTNTGSGLALSQLTRMLNSLVVSH